MNHVTRIKFGKKVFQFQTLEKGLKSGKFLEDGKMLFSGSIFKNGKPISLNKLNSALLKKGAKVINLARTPGFGVGAGVIAIAAGVIGYLLGKTDNKVVPEENQEQVIPENKTGNVVLTKSVENQYHTINSKGLMWENIVNAYYPDLLKQCNGKMYGKDGAIRQLKIALTKDMDIDLINETAIPETLNLPLEINGVEINKKAIPTHSKCKQGGYTDIKEAGAKSTKTTYKATDEENNAEFEWNKYPDVIDSLKVRTGVDEYKVQADTLSVVA